MSLARESAGGHGKAGMDTQELPGAELLRLTRGDEHLATHRNAYRFVFANHRGQVRTMENTCRSIREVFQRAGLYQKGMPLTHLIRHSVCSHLLGNGVDIETVRVVMGHASIQTTQGYAHTTADRMRKVAQTLPW
jgi:site-specific recombinase XerD